MTVGHVMVTEERVAIAAYGPIRLLCTPCVYLRGNFDRSFQTRSLETVKRGLFVGALLVDVCNMHCVQSGFEPARTWFTFLNLDYACLPRPIHPRQESVKNHIPAATLNPRHEASLREVCVSVDDLWLIGILESDGIRPSGRFEIVN